jgi:tetratricopeptide (TPR) repeat protein
MNRSPIPFFLAALAAILVLQFLALDRGPLDRAPLGAEVLYWDAARGLHDGTTDPETLSGSVALYSRVLQPAAGIGLGVLGHVRRVQTGIVTALFALSVFALARPRTGPWPAAAAGLSVALFAPVIVSAGFLDPAVVAACLVLAALVALQRWEGVPGRVVAGMLAGAGAWFHPPLGGASAVTLIGLALFCTRSRARWVRSATVAAGVMVGITVLAPVASRETLLPTTSSLELYRGHRVEARGLDPLRGDHDPDRWLSRHDYFLLAAEGTKARPTPEWVEKYWRNRAFIEGLTRPDREVVRTLRKVYAALQAHPIPHAVSLELLRERADRRWPYTVSLWITVFLLPLGVAGVFLSRRRLGWVLWAGLLTGPAAAFWTYAQPGSRLVTVAVLAVGVGLFLVRLGERRLRTGIVGAVSIGVFGFLPPLVLEGFGIGSHDHFSLGTLYTAAGQGSAAMREFDRALRLDPDNPLPRIAMADMLARDRVFDEAIAELEHVRAAQPRMIQPREALARLYHTQARFDEAVAAYQELIQRVPSSPEYFNGLGAVYLQTGYFDRAEQSFRSALAIDPDHRAARSNLDGMMERGFALSTGSADTTRVRIDAERVMRRLRAGDLDGARAALAAGYERWGADNTQLRFTEGTLRLHSGECAEGIRIYESLRSNLGRQDVFLNNLGAAYAQCGDLENAIAVWEDAVKLNPSNMLIRESIQRARKQLAGPPGGGDGG